MNRRILQLALPSIVSNITVPLLGLVDVAIVGHFGAAAYIGAIAVGGMLFNILYWLFGFLRMGTSGMTSQALGRRDLAEVTRVLLRSLGVGVGIALLLVLLQYPIQQIAFALLDTSAEVETLATLYFRICIWGAPAVLGLYGFSGWFIGMQNSRTPMTVSIISNVVNVVFSWLFAFRFDMGIAGVAWGTVVAQYTGVAVSWIFWGVYYGRLRRYVSLKDSIRLKSMTRFFHINKDIFLRTLCLVVAYTFFTAASSRFGDTVLATNTLLMQLFTLFSYMSDGFAYAAESLAGRYIGAGNRRLLRDAIRKLFVWSFGIAVAYVLVYLVGWRGILSIFNPDADVLAMARHYIWWVIAIPLVGCVPFLVDGILLGATNTKVLRNTVAISMAGYFVLYYSTVGTVGNNAVWLAFVGFIALRGILLMIATHNLNADRLMSGKL